MRFPVGTALLVAACGGSAAKPTADMAMTGDVYAVATTVNANTPSATSLLFTVDRLDSGTADSSKAIAIADTISLYGVENSAQVFVTQAMTPIITRYDVAADGTLTAGPMLDLSGLGLGSTYSTRSIVFVSATKAYLLDDTTLQAVIFDPSAMTLGAPVSLSGMAEAGYHTNFSYNVPMRGSQVVIAGYYYDSTYAHTIAKTAIALLDSTTDAVTILHDTRCGAFSTAVTAPNGDIYFGSDSFAAAINRVAGASAAPPGCFLRMNAGQSVLDPSYFVQVSDITGGKSGGGVVPANGNALYTRVLDETLYPVTAATSSTVLLAAPAWRWWKLDLDTPTAPAVQSSDPPGSGETKYYTAGGNAYAGNSADNYSTSTLVNLTAAAAPTDGATVTGFPSGIVKTISK